MRQPSLCPAMSLGAFGDSVAVPRSSLLQGPQPVCVYRKNSSWKWRGLKVLPQIPPPCTSQWRDSVGPGGFLGVAVPQPIPCPHTHHLSRSSVGEAFLLSQVQASKIKFFFLGYRYATQVGLPYPYLRPVCRHLESGSRRNFLGIVFLFCFIFCFFFLIEKEQAGHRLWGLGGHTCTMASHLKM